MICENEPTEAKCYQRDLTLESEHELRSLSQE